MDNAIDVVYLAAIELDDGIFSKVFNDKSPIQNRKESLDWLQEQCPELLDEKLDFKELKVKLMFIPEHGIHSLIFYFRIKDKMLLYEKKEGIDREWITKNLSYEYSYYQDNKLDVQDFFSLEDFKTPILGINFMLDKKYYLGSSYEEPRIIIANKSFSVQNTEIDAYIKHALKLFYNDNATFQDKRSACETLGFILEPLRKELEPFFSKKEINTLFSLLNNYKIRHNRPNSKEIEEEEQFDLIFKLLFNTIKIYYSQKHIPKS